MDVVDGDEIAGNSLLGSHQQVEAGLGVVSTCTAGTLGVNRCEVVDAAGALQIQLSPGYQGHPAPLQEKGLIGWGRIGEDDYLTAVLVGKTQSYISMPRALHTTRSTANLIFF